MPVLFPKYLDCDTTLSEHEELFLWLALDPLCVNLVAVQVMHQTGQLQFKIQNAK